MTAINDLLLQGPRGAPELRQHLGISQATFSRLVATQQQVIKFGKARATRYALLRPVRGISVFPFWQVNAEGRAIKGGEIYPTWPQGSCLVLQADGQWQWFDSLPWYLTDLRPQGFLGRAWGRRLAQQFSLPEDIRLWQESDVLYALSQFSGEHSGGWLVGEKNYQRWLCATPPQPITDFQKNRVYAQLSREALAGEIVGFSAGGEQPKFSCFAQTATGDAHVLVKFTAPQSSAVSVRWGDLLFAEAIAHSTLTRAGLAASDAIALQGESGQVFLEAKRFDCEGVTGRRAILSLEAVQSEFVTASGAWPHTVEKLVQAGIVEATAAGQVEKIWAFGRLIANSDMHAGNLSFYYSAFPLSLAPVYDMLPMAFAPSSAGMMREEACELRFDSTISRQAWEFALPLAAQFWQQVMDEKRISENFRTIAAGMKTRLSDIAVMVQRMA